MTAAMLRHKVSFTVSIIRLPLMLLAVFGMVVTGVGGGETDQVLTKGWPIK